MTQLANGKLNITVEDTSIERSNINFYIYARTGVTDVDAIRSMQSAWSRMYTINVACDTGDFIL